VLSKRKFVQQFPDQIVDPTENKTEPMYSQLRGKKYSLRLEI
jgi:hypothetical protein